MLAVVHWIMGGAEPPKVKPPVSTIELEARKNAQEALEEHERLMREAGWRPPFVNPS